MTDELALVDRFVRPEFAHLAKAKLQAYGIDCLLENENIVGMNLLLPQVVGGVKLLVAKEDLEVARQVLDDAMAP